MAGRFISEHILKHTDESLIEDSSVCVVVQFKISSNVQASIACTLPFRARVLAQCNIALSNLFTAFHFTHAYPKNCNSYATTGYVTYIYIPTTHSRRLQPLEGGSTSPAMPAPLFHEFLTANKHSSQLKQERYFDVSRL